MDVTGIKQDSIQYHYYDIDGAGFFKHRAFFYSPVRLTFHFWILTEYCSFHSPPNELTVLLARYCTMANIRLEEFICCRNQGLEWIEATPEYRINGGGRIIGGGLEMVQYNSNRGVGWGWVLEK